MAKVPAGQKIVKPGLPPRPPMPKLPPPKGK